MATLEELMEIATQEIEAAKPLFKLVDNVRRELNEEEYLLRISDLANTKFDIQENGYKETRQLAYGSYAEQLDMMYWDAVNGTTNWQDHIAEVKANNPKPA